MKIRFRQLPRPATCEGVESRFPAGTRSGEGSESVRVFVEAARKSRVEPLPLRPSPLAGAAPDSPASNATTASGDDTES